jgi:hypothetical protein
MPREMIVITRRVLISPVARPRLRSRPSRRRHFHGGNGRGRQIRRLVICPPMLTSFRPFLGLAEVGLDSCHGCRMTYSS